MSQDSAIQWTEATWNPLAGCKEISPGCTHCYAAVIAHRLAAMGQTKYIGTTRKLPNGKIVWTGKMNLDADALMIPIKRKKPTTYFVNSMSDLFHEDVPDEFIDKVFGVMALAHWHTFQVLTKRADRMQAYFAEKYQSPNFMIVNGKPTIGEPTGELNEDREDRVKQEAVSLALKLSDSYDKLIFDAEGHHLMMRAPWPLPNVWLGVSVENRQHGRPRIEHLLRTPAAVRFLSVEPLLEEVVLPWHCCPTNEGDSSTCLVGPEGCLCDRLHWVICGSESGHGRRPMRQEWAENIADQCKSAGVKFFMKQMEIDGKVTGDITKFPKHLQVREMPTTNGR